MSAGAGRQQRTPAPLGISRALRLEESDKAMFGAITKVLGYGSAMLNASSSSARECCEAMAPRYTRPIAASTCACSGAPVFKSVGVLNG